MVENKDEYLKFLVRKRGLQKGSAYSYGRYLETASSRLNLAIGASTVKNREDVDSLIRRFDETGAAQRYKNNWKTALRAYHDFLENNLGNLSKSKSNVEKRSNEKSFAPHDYFSSTTNQPTYTEPAGGIPVPKKRSIMFRARQRNLELVEYARWRANFKCEIDPEHHTFTSIASNQPYIEVHHLVPLSRQGDYKFSLDVAANVVALCPMCHKRMHHGILDHEKRIALKKLLSARKENLKEKKIRLTEKTLLSYYHFEFADDEVLLQSKSCSEATVTPGELYRQLQEECKI